MVTLHVLYVYDLVFKAFLVWLLLGLVGGGALYVKKVRRWFLFIMLFTLVYTVSFFVIVSIQKEKANLFLNEQENYLVNAKEVKVKLEHYGQTGEIEKKTYSLSPSGVEKITDIFSKNEWKMLPRFGPPSTNNRIKLFCDDKNLPLFIVYEKKIIMITKYSFELDSVRLWDYLIEASNGDILPK